MTARPSVSFSVLAHILAIPVFSCLLTALGACSPKYPDQAASSTSSSTAPVSKAATSPAVAPTAVSPAAEAFVLVQENKERCLKISRDGAKVMEDAAAAGSGDRFVRSSDTPRGQLRKYLETEVKGESFLVDAIEDIVRQSLGRIPPTQRDLSVQLRSLFASQQQLCQAARRSYVSDADEYRAEVSASLHTYTQTEQRLLTTFRVSDAERQKIHRQHEAALVAVAEAAGGTYRPMVVGGGGSFGPGRQKSPEEWARERREYEGKLRRREQMQAEHRRSVGEWRDRERRREEEPSVGVSARPTTMSPHSVLRPQTSNLPLQKQMNAWHKDYIVRSDPAKAAIQRYLDARKTGNLALVEPACRDLKAACDQLLARRGVLYAPDPAVQRDLEEAFTRFQTVGATCRDDQVTSASRAFERAAATLRNYGLRP